MYLDIAICIFFFVCLIIGWHVGFMRAVVGFFATFISLAVAIFTARPIAGFLSNLVGMNNHFINILIVGVVVFIFLRVTFWFVSRFISKIKDKSQGIDTIDKFAGLVLGVAKFVLGMITFFSIIHLMSAIPFVNQVNDWLFDRSTIGEYIYRLVQRILPF